MLNPAALLSRIFLIYLKYQGAQWLIGIGLAWYGLYTGRDDLSLAYPWWIGAGALVAGYWVADAFGFALFLPEPDVYAGTRTRTAPAVTYGVAAGNFDCWDHLRMRHPMRLVNASVQIRWLTGRVPELAVLTPAGLEPTLMSPVEAAEASSLWYEGSEVTRGRVYIGGVGYPGLRLRFLGRQMLLGLDSEDEVALLAEALRAD